MDESTGSAITIDCLQEESHRAYLKKRESRELTLLERELEDERDLFGDMIDDDGGGGAEGGGRRGWG